ncbi:MAG: glycosyltransferase family 4 protein [Fimbriimonadaceae bacterium]
MKTPVIAIDAHLVGSKNTGDTSYWRGLICGLSTLKNKCEIHLFSDEHSNPELSFLGHFQWHRVTAPNPRLWSLHAFPQAAKEIGASVLHTQYNISPFTKIKAITTIHDVSFLVEPNWYKLKDRILLTRQIPRSVKRAKRILTVSETSKREIEHFIPAAQGKTIVTYNALRTDFPIYTRQEAIDYLKALHKISADFPYILAPTSSWARKNSDLSAYAHRFSDLKNTHTLVTFGPGDPLTPESLHLGYVSDDAIPALYAAADYFILPSLHEGFGIPILEAFASGTPVICGTGGAIPEIAGDAAIICPDYLPTTWANALNHLHDDSGKLEAMIKRGKSRVHDFSWTKTAELTMQAYEEVANGE